jgi:hypothetical protein
MRDPVDHGGSSAALVPASSPRPPATSSVAPASAAASGSGSACRVRPAVEATMPPPGGQVDGVGLGQAGVARLVIGAGEDLGRAGGVQQQKAG